MKNRKPTTRKGDRRGGFPPGVLVDDEDRWLENAFTWHMHGDGYIETSLRYKGRKINLLLHRCIMWPQPDQQVDHINHNRMDNRRSNLRCVTPGQNNFNRKGPTAISKTGVLGVFRGKRGFHVSVGGGKFKRSIFRSLSFEEASAKAMQFRQEIANEIYP